MTTFFIGTFMIDLSLQGGDPKVFQRGVEEGKSGVV